MTLKTDVQRRNEIMMVIKRNSKLNHLSFELWNKYCDSDLRGGVKQIFAKSNRIFYITLIKLTKAFLKPIKRQVTSALKFCSN